MHPAAAGALNLLDQHYLLPNNPALMNAFVLRHLKAVEMAGVLMRIASFSVVSWLGPASPFLFVWARNTVDAIMLTWCARLRRDAAYTLLNGFWILVGLIGILRAKQWLP